jgi:hypothetical protein
MTARSLARSGEPTDAKRLTKQIKATFTRVNSGLNMLSLLVTKAKAGDAHLALGYRSWTEYVSAEFAGCSLRLDREDRRELVALLAGEGMSTRAIAPIIGTSEGTVRNDLAGAQDYAPDHKVTGIDGKMYSRPEPAVIEAAVKGDPETRATANRALDQLYDEELAERRQRRAEPKQESPHAPYDDAIKLAIKLRAAQRNLDDAVLLAQDIRGAGAAEIGEAVGPVVAVLRRSLDAVEAGAHAGPLDEQITRLFDGEGGEAG